MPRLVAQQHRPLPGHAPQRANLALRTKGPTQQTETHQLLQPLAVEHVRFAPRDVLHMPSIHQIHREPTRLQQLEQRDPVHPRRLHRYGVHFTGRQPLGQAVQVFGKAGILPYRLLVPIWGDRYKMTGRTHIDPRGVGMGQFEYTLANAHGLLHYQGWKGRAASGTSLTLTLSNGMFGRPNSPMSPTLPRTMLTHGCDHTIDASVFGGAVFPPYRKSAHRVSSKRAFRHGRLFS